MTLLMFLISQKCVLKLLVILFQIKVILYSPEMVECSLFPNWIHPLYLQQSFKVQTLEEGLKLVCVTNIGTVEGTITWNITHMKNKPFISFLIQKIS